MPNKEYVLTMAKYNLWQNQNLLETADTLTAADREKDRGAFFGSIQNTFSHILWGDTVWLSRFTDTPISIGGIPESTDLIENWGDFKNKRQSFDAQIFQWAKEVSTDWFEGDLSWFSGAVGRDVTKPKKLLVIQLFNHQTHHRGQIHAMLTAAGAKPGHTDVPFMPETYLNM
ncbi:MAG: damage-inducible protein DinB [Rhizobiales bacterium]|nr:damage-inducible protein DinB [Hyphomicrobiales bacterium]